MRVTPKSEATEKRAEHLGPIERLPFSLEELKHDQICLA